MEGREFVELRAGAFAPSGYKEVTLGENRQLTLYKTIETEDGLRYEAAASSSVPSDYSEVLAIIVPGSNGRFGMGIYDDSWNDFPARSLRVINVSPVQLASRIGKQTIQLEPLRAGMVEVEYVGNRPITNVLTVYKDQGGEWQTVYNQPTAVLPNWRVTGVAVGTRGGLARAQGAEFEEGDPAATTTRLEFFTFHDIQPTNGNRY
jgi:hypothetical protein